ncbi:MAG: hypothetical protein ABSA63_06435 [Thermoplasmata archaeon]|jgi:hypothetical protein
MKKPKNPAVQFTRRSGGTILVSITVAGGSGISTHPNPVALVPNRGARPFTTFR